MYNEISIVAVFSIRLVAWRIFLLSQEFEVRIGEMLL